MTHEVCARPANCRLRAGVSIRLRRGMQTLCPTAQRRAGECPGGEQLPHADLGRRGDQPGAISAQRRHRRNSLACRLIRLLKDILGQCEIARPREMSVADDGFGRDDAVYIHVEEGWAVLAVCAARLIEHSPAPHFAVLVVLDSLRTAADDENLSSRAPFPDGIETLFYKLQFLIVVQRNLLEHRIEPASSAFPNSSAIRTVEPELKSVAGPVIFSIHGGPKRHKHNFGSGQGLIKANGIFIRPIGYAFHRLALGDQMPVSQNESGIVVADSELALVAVDELDRKSTRLNSSHGSI